MTSDDRLDPESRERKRAFERSERIERLGWVIFAFFAAGFVLITPSPWRLWLVLAIAAWWLVGFLLQLGSEESVGRRLLFAPFAPLGFLLFAPLLLPGKDAWTGRKIQTQLERIAAENVRADSVVDGNVTIGDVRPGEANFGWWGDAKVALQRLRGVRDNAGRDALWSAFPEKTHSPSRDLTAELERICGVPDTFPVMWGVPGPNGAQLLVDRTVFDDTPSPDTEWEWEGTTEEVIERLRRVPDGAGRAGIWWAFPDKVPAPERR